MRQKKKKNGDEEQKRRGKEDKAQRVIVQLPNKKGKSTPKNTREFRKRMKLPEERREIRE